MPDVALTRLRIPGAHALAGDELLRAAGYALAREAGLEHERLHLAVRKPQVAIGHADDCLIAWTLDQVSSTPWLGLADSRTIWCLHDIAIGPGGSVELAASAAPGVLPPALLMLVAASPQAERLALIDPPAVLAEQRDLLQASTGLDVESMPASALPRTDILPLLPLPAAPERADWDGLDRALVACALATCVFLSVNLWPLLIAPPPAAAHKQTAPSGGSLLLRALHAAPALAEGLQQADYEAPAWVLVIRLPAAQDAAIEAALRRNGLSVQMARQGEELRLRLRSSS